MGVLMKLGIQHNVMGIWFVMQLTFLCVLNLSIYRTIILKGYRPISTYFCFDNLSIIESSGEDSSTSICTFVLYFSVLYFSWYIYFVLYFSYGIKTNSISVTDHFAICLEAFWSDSK